MLVVESAFDQLGRQISSLAVMQKIGNEVYIRKFLVKLRTLVFRPAPINEFEEIETDTDAVDADPSMPDALVGLIGAEAEAIEVAGVAIQGPTTPDLGPRADRPGARVLQAVQAYVCAAAAVLERSPLR